MDISQRISHQHGNKCLHFIHTISIWTSLSFHIITMKAKSPTHQSDVIDALVRFVLNNPMSLVAILPLWQVKILLVHFLLIVSINYYSM